ncbi:MAG: glycosyltransferase family 39 protein [Syntrophomonadaceae bacterium]|nr:glycosyltransferase family 39 protein [Syntrophomonadaceae bacterium]
MISGWFEKLSKAYSLAILLLIAVAICYFVVHDRTTGAGWQAGLLLAALMLAGGLAFVSVRFYKKSKYMFYAFVILLSAVSCAWWNLFADTQPVSDYSILIDAGYQIANGNFSEAFSKDSYFYYFNYQIGYAIYLGFVFRLFGASLTVLKILDAAYIAFSALLVFAIASRIAGKHEACIAAGLYAGFIPIIMGSSVVNNQHLSTFLMLAGIYMVIRRKSAYIGLGALFIAAMNIFRPVGVIMLIAVPVYFFYRAFYERRIMPSIKYTAVFLAVFFAVTWGVDAAVINARIAPAAISSSNLPYFKLVSGLCDQFGSFTET